MTGPHYMLLDRLVQTYGIRIPVGKAYGCLVFLVTLRIRKTGEHGELI